MTMTMTTVISDHLRADVTPQYLAYAPVSASIRNMLLAAAAQDAEVVYHLLLASALVDKTELRLDMPPAVESKFQRERSTLVKIIEQATATPPGSSAPDTPVLQAVKAFIKAVEEFDNVEDATGRSARWGQDQDSLGGGAASTRSLVLGYSTTAGLGPRRRATTLVRYEVAGWEDYEHDLRQ